MRPLHLILNNKSAARPEIRVAVGRMRKQGCSIGLSVTWESGDASQFAHQFGGDPALTVVAGGGDGTINEVLGGLLRVGSGVSSLAILPLGTANDFATSATIPLHDFEAALRLAACGKPVACDVGCVAGRWFLNMASGGFGAEVTAHTPAALKNALGGSAYELEAVAIAVRPYVCHAQVLTPADAFTGDLVMFAVGNGRQAGGGAVLAPHAFIDDGLLDLTLVPIHEAGRLPHLIADLARLRAGKVDGFRQLRALRFRIETQEDVQVNLDGEPLFGCVFEFKVHPGVVRLILPTGCPLIQTS